MNTKFIIRILELTLSVIITSCSSNQSTNELSENGSVLDSQEVAMNEYYACYADIDEEEEDDDYVECAFAGVEDVDMSADLTYYTSEGNIIYVIRDSYGNISGHDLNGNYISGYSDQYGYTSIHDLDGNYVYSYTDDYGYTTTHDLNGNYSYSYTDDYGYTTGHDVNGNYYSAYTDDFGYTTINNY